MFKATKLRERREREGESERERRCLRRAEKTATSKLITRGKRRADRVDGAEVLMIP